MSNDDFEQFATCWMQAHEIVGRKPTATAIEWSFEVLRDQSLGDIKKALIANARDPENGRFAPTPAAVIGQINIMNQAGESAYEYL